VDLCAEELSNNVRAASALLGDIRAVVSQVNYSVTWVILQKYNVFWLASCQSALSEKKKDPKAVTGVILFQKVHFFFYHSSTSY